jgi:ribosomal protein L37AE/L43A
MAADIIKEPWRILPAYQVGYEAEKRTWRYYCPKCLSAVRRRDDGWECSPCRIIFGGSPEISAAQDSTRLRSAEPGADGDS